MTTQMLHRPDYTAFSPFTRSNQPLEGRTVPDLHTQAIGQIVEEFADLERMLRLGLVRFRASAPPDLPFDSKVELIASLARQHNRDRGLGLEHTIDLMVARWQKAKQMRDRVLRLPPEYGYRQQVELGAAATASAEEIPDDQFDAGYLLDIADFICSLAGNTELFLLSEEEPQQPSNRADARQQDTETNERRNARALMDAAIRSHRAAASSPENRSART